jgi:hypothetical protein
MKELKELIKFLLGFMPWLLFLFLSGHTLASLERSIIIALLANPLFGFKELRKGFILQWGTLLFFIACAITINLMHMMFFAKYMGIISNGFLAGIIWVTLFIGKPFTLQYATAELPKERWNDPALIRSCRFIALVWAIILTFSTLIACIKILKPDLFPGWVYFDISILTILGGSIFTTLYKTYKRNQYHPAN